MNELLTFKARMAAPNDAASEERKRLKEALLKGKKVAIGNSGKVSTDTTTSATFIPDGKLAVDDDIANVRRNLRNRVHSQVEVSDEQKNRNAALAKALKESKPIRVGEFNAPPGKLAVNQWYEKEPWRLDAEKEAMRRAYPGFQLGQLEDGRLYWHGELCLGIWNNQKWYVMAVYNNNHPQQVMGSSVRVYLVEPDIHELIEQIGWRPYHLLVDANNDLYLCTAQAEDVKVGKASTSAASTLNWAVKWLAAFELVMTGDLPKEDFNTHGVI